MSLTREYLEAELRKAENAAAFAINPRMAAWPKAQAARLRELLERMPEANSDEP